VLFASLFAVYAVLHGNTFGGPGNALFSLPFVLEETLILLSSSFACGLALLSAREGSERRALWWLGVTFVLGVAFAGLELSEFARLASAGNGWGGSAFLSSYFTLVGTHGLHVVAGLMWIGALAVALARRGLTPSNVRKLTLLSLFWHFLDVIWIFIFSFVYLIGSL
jgi:cytochrome o ubiquinol oxidase subunit 3